jgi:hypothetical protein
MVAIALVLIVLGGLSCMVVVAAVQSAASGSVDVVLLGIDAGRLSVGATVAIATGLGLLAGLGVLGVVLLRHRRARVAHDRASLAETARAARARLLEYRVQLLTDQLDRLESERDPGAPGVDRQPLGTAAVEPKLVPGRRAPERPLKEARAKELARPRLVVVPDVDEPKDVSAARGGGSG